MKADNSEFKFFSMGIVTETKKENSDQIRVTPIEDFQQAKGYLNENKRNYEIELPDAQGKKRKTKSTGEDIIVASWLPMGQSNRMTSPNVVANETVILYKYSDTDSYYWDTCMREPSLRRLEHVVHGYSNLKSGMTPFDKKTSYWSEWDTINKVVRLHTSKSDGEPFEYDAIIDTKQGVFSFTDDIKNFFKLESKISKWTLETLDKIYITDNSHTEYILLDKSTGTIKVVTKKGVTIQHTGAGAHVTIKENGAIVAHSPSSIDLHAPSITFHGATSQTGYSKA